MKESLKKFWHIIEPFVNELIAYSFVILAFELLRRYIDIYLDEKMREAINSIKQIVLLGTLSLFAFHLLISLFIRIVVEIIDECNSFRNKIKSNRKSKRDTLKQKPPKFDEAAEIKKVQVKAIKIENKVIKEKEEKENEN